MRTPIITSIITSVLLAACGAIMPHRAALDVGLRNIGPRALDSQEGRTLRDAIAFFWPDVLSPPWMSRSLMLRGVEPVGVYANGASIGSFDALGMLASRAAGVHRITPIEEQLQFGRQHPAGAIIVEWKR